MVMMIDLIFFLFSLGCEVVIFITDVFYTKHSQNIIFFSTPIIHTLIRMRKLRSLFMSPPPINKSKFRTNSLRGKKFIAAANTI